MHFYLLWYVCLIHHRLKINLFLSNAMSYVSVELQKILMNIADSFLPFAGIKVPHCCRQIFAKWNKWHRWFRFKQFPYLCNKLLLNMLWLYASVNIYCIPWIIDVFSVLMSHWWVWNNMCHVWNTSLILKCVSWGWRWKSIGFAAK